MTERFQAIPGYEGRYAISESGVVVSFLSGRARQMTPVLQRGYRCVGLRDNDGRRRFHGIHRLLLMSYVRTPRDDEQARHLNDDRLDNRLDNLAWGSGCDNSQDAIRNGRNPFLNKTHCPAGHPYAPESTYMSGGHRKCAVCVAERGRIYRQRTVRSRVACPDCGAEMRSDYLGKHQARRHQLVEAGKPTHGGGGE